MHDPNIIHECSACGRHYAIRPTPGMNHWHFYNIYCSRFCALRRDDQAKWRYIPDAPDAIFRFFEQAATRLYKSLLQQVRDHGKVINPPYWYGQHYEDAHPYRFASHFMDSTERAAFLSASERKAHAEAIFGIANDLHQEVRT